MSKTSLYEFTKTVAAYDWIEYAFIAMCVMFFVTQILRPSWFFFIGLIFVVFFVYMRIDQKRSTVSSRNKEWKFRMNSLNPRPQNFHMDPDLIDLFYNMREFRTYNSEASLMWNGKKGGSVVKSGIYIYQFKAGSKHYNGTMVLAK